MHSPSLFQNDDRDEALAFIKAHPFALLAINGAEGPETALVPLVIDHDRNDLIGHVARVNPIWKIAAAKSNKAAAVFRGADAYISASYYPSKAEHGRVVPTWNYVAVEVRGKIVVETSPEKMMPYITALTDQMESHRDLPWQVSDAPPDYIGRMSRAIIGLRVQIGDINYVRKLSQNKSETDKAGVIAGLQDTHRNEDLALAQDMTS